MVFFIFCINCAVHLIVGIWIFTARRNPQISGIYHRLRLCHCFFIKPNSKQGQYLRPMTKRITAPFSSNLRNWSPTKCSTFYMKKGSTVQKLGKGHPPCGIHVCLIESLRLRLAKVVKTPITKDILCRMIPWSPSESLGDMPWLIAWAALAAARRISMSEIVLSKALKWKHQYTITIPCLVKINSELGKFISE